MKWVLITPTSSCNWPTQERDEVSAAYNHATYLKQRAKMMQDWADYLDSSTTGKVLVFERAAA